MRAHRGVPYASEEEPKTCCGMSASQAVSIRWFIIVIAVIGICCTLAGTALGAARSAGKEHLTLSLLMIGKISKSTTVKYFYDFSFFV